MSLHRDADGNMLMGGYTYRLRVQADVPVTGGRFDFGTGKRIFQSQAEWLARESRRRRRKRVLVKIIGK